MRVLGLAATAAMVSGAAFAQSSKFTAAYDTDGVLLAGAYYDTADADDIHGNNTGFDFDGPGFAAHMGTIKAPQGKELLVGVSAVPGLVTFTEAKGKNGAGASSSVAIAGVGMQVAYAHTSWLPAEYTAGDVCNEGLVAAPGPVPLSVRLQYLSVSVDLDVVDVAAECNDQDETNDAECIADLLDIEGDVTVALGLATAASHHFNFLVADLPQSGDYAVAACFGGAAVAGVIEGEGSALSIAALGKRMMTVQEVRAVKDTEFDVTE